MRLIDAEKLKDMFRELYKNEDVIANEPLRITLRTLLYYIDTAPTEVEPEENTNPNTDAYVRGYNAGVQMSIKLFLSLGGEDDDSEVHS